MEIEFDDRKDRSNRAKHGISLARASDMEILRFVDDDRRDYGEPRFRAWGLIDGKMYALAFTLRNDTVRVISLRRAHDREIRRHVKDR